VKLQRLLCRPCPSVRRLASDAEYFVGFSRVSVQAFFTANSCAANRDPTAHTAPLHFLPKFPTVCLHTVQLNGHNFGADWRNEIRTAVMGFSEFIHLLSAYFYIFLCVLSNISQDIFIHCCYKRSVRWLTSHDSMTFPYVRNKIK
jgi:hypothetical protein